MWLSAVANISVVPSASAFAICSAAIIEPAPGRFSTTTSAPVSRETWSAM